MKKRWFCVPLLGAVAAAVAALPAAWIGPHVTPDPLDLEWTGTVWNGQVENLPVFDTLNFKAEGLAFNVRGASAGNRLLGWVRPGHLRETDVQLQLSDLPIDDPRLRGLQGVLSVQLTDLKWSKLGCTLAEGRARTDVLARNGGAINWTGPELSGPLACEDGAVVVRLRGQDAQQKISADLTFQIDGTYRADIAVETTRAEAGAILPLFGFSASGRDFKLTEQGRWR